ncbi:MAG: hypothetical protein LBP22_15215 [Deltaproteobacteria bacterium]|jgi:hypothetical protein|nr:hypothetical protein [Deltaproteobacteria bacterium]
MALEYVKGEFTLSVALSLVLLSVSFVRNLALGFFSQPEAVSCEGASVCLGKAY